GEGARLVVDTQAAGAANARPAHAPRHHRGMAGHAAARGQNARRRMHAVNVLRTGLDPDQDHLAALGLGRLGLVGIEHDLPAGSPLAMVVFSALASIVGCSSWSRALASMRITASSSSIRPSATRSAAILRAALTVRLPDRVCSIHSLPSCTVNSTSCMSR